MTEATSKKRVLSLGAGVQSSTLALMSARGELPTVDCAIFADTQAEPQAVYDYLDWLESVLPYPVYRVTHGNLWRSASEVRRTRDGQRTYISTGIPVYTVENGLQKGMGKRQCTRTFKVEPVTRKCRELLGLKRVTKKHGELVEMWIGISSDEADRMKPAAAPWIRASWPLIDLGMSRADCLAWMQQRGYPEPPRSACTFCPFRDDDSWMALTEAERADAAAKERQLQAAYTATTELRSTPYLHHSRQPLALVKFQPGRINMLRAQTTMFSKFRNECEGFCGV
jgi:hypothetical protein